MSAMCRCPNSTARHPRCSLISSWVSHLPMASISEQPTPPPGGHEPSETPFALSSHEPTPLLWRAGIGGAILVLGLAAYQLRNAIGPRGQALAGIFCFFGLVAMFSINLRLV